jgi:hypothetical protein
MPPMALLLLLLLLLQFSDMWLMFCYRCRKNSLQPGLNHSCCAQWLMAILQLQALQMCHVLTG